MKPILFNTEMVRAIPDGRKTVTRRLVKPQPKDQNDIVYFNPDCGKWFISPDNDLHPETEIKPPYAPGDILYVRETWRRQPLKWSRESGYSDFELQYRADFTDEENACYGRRGGVAPWKWHPSIHMPKEAARIFLRVKDVRVERLQDITDEEARKEGCVDRQDFVRVWNDCYAKPRPVKGEDGTIDHYESYPWEDIQETREYRGKPWYVIGNPWLWVIKFERISKEEV